MTLEELRGRKAELDSTIMQLASQWQTCQGHLGEVCHWISRLEAADSPPSELVVAPEDQAVVE